VALSAIEVAAVIERFVWKPDVPVVGWRPGVRCVAQATVLCGIKVPGIHARSCRAVVAGRTRAEDLIVIDGDNGRPYIRTVAVLADVSRERVQRALASRIRTVMAVGAVANNIRMVEVRGRPRNCRMAVIAVVSARNVCRMFTCGDHAVVARAAGPDDLCVIDVECRQPGVRGMAVFANIAGLNVSWVLASRICAVVAAGTVPRNVDVVEVGGQPTCCGMTVFTVITARNMCRCLSGRDHAVVARAASSYDLSVIDIVGRYPYVGGVAVFAHFRR